MISLTIKIKKVIDKTNVKKLTAKEFIIKIWNHYDDSEYISTYATVWFDGENPVVAEPHNGLNGKDRHYYNRTTDFILESCLEC